MTIRILGNDLKQPGESNKFFKMIFPPDTPCELIHQEAARYIIAERIKSKDWWVFLVFQSLVNEFGSFDKEHRNSQIEIFVGPGYKVGVACIAFCNKSLLSPLEILNFILKQGDTTLSKEDLKERDLFVLCEPEEREGSLKILRGLNAWLNSSQNQN